MPYRCSEENMSLTGDELMKHKILWVLFLITILFIGPRTSYAIPKTFPYGEPLGFREMKWGDDISDYPEMKLLFFADGDMEELCKINEDLNIFNFKANNIIYRFYRGKFEGVKITYKLNYYDSILNFAYNKWGKETLNNKNLQEISWKGKKSLVIIEKDRYATLKILYRSTDFNVNPSYKEREFGKLFIEPKGLNGLYIGDSFIKHEKNLIFSFKDFDNKRYYHLRDNLLGFDVVEKAIPAYVFLNDKLVEIKVKYFGKKEFIKLLDSLEQQFGKACGYYLKDNYICKWDGIDVQLCLTYYGKDDDGTVRISDNNTL